MRRTAVAAVLACAMLLATSIVSPAFGGPSVGSIAKTAKKALKIGKSASRAATAAKRTAASANTTANRGQGVRDGGPVSRRLSQRQGRSSARSAGRHPRRNCPRREPGLVGTARRSG